MLATTGANRGIEYTGAGVRRQTPPVLSRVFRPISCSLSAFRAVVARFALAAAAAAVFLRRGKAAGKIDPPPSCPPQYTSPPAFSPTRSGKYNATTAVPTRRHRARDFVEIYYSYFPTVSRGRCFLRAFFYGLARALIFYAVSRSCHYPLPSDGKPDEGQCWVTRTRHRSVSTWRACGCATPLHFFVFATKRVLVTSKRVFRPDITRTNGHWTRHVGFFKRTINSRSNPMEIYLHPARQRDTVFTYVFTVSFPKII